MGRTHSELNIIQFTELLTYLVYIVEVAEEGGTVPVV